MKTSESRPATNAMSASPRASSFCHIVFVVLGHLRPARCATSTTCRCNCSTTSQLDHRVMLDQRVHPAQPAWPQFVSVGQQDFEQTPLTLSALNHARSFRG